jgi:hypothetical protein
MTATRARLTAAVLALSTATATLLIGAAAPARAAVPVPKLPVRLPVAIEVLPPYQPQTFCDPHEKPGITAFKQLLTRTYVGTAIVDTVRPCASDTSEHYDGRAIDWGVDHRNVRQRAQGNAFLAWLFATDAAGNHDAMLRRLGVMYVIWNKRIWGAWDHRWAPYSCSGPTACHIDHMHLSFDWSGAMKKTSFWTGRVQPPMPPPVQKLTRLHDKRSVAVSPRDPNPVARYGAVAHGRYRFTVRGTYNDDGHRHHRADASCSTTDGRHWAAVAPADTEGAIGTFDLFVAGRHHWSPRPRTTTGCSVTHTYTRTITFRRATPFLFRINDPTGWAASGSLSVVVERVG